MGMICVRGKSDTSFRLVCDIGRGAGTLSHSVLGTCFKAPTGGASHAVSIHTSCSKPLAAGMVVGDFAITDLFARRVVL